MIIQLQAEVAAENTCDVLNMIYQMEALRGQAMRERGTPVCFTEIATWMNQSNTLPDQTKFELAEALDKVQHAAVKEWLAQQAARVMLG